MSGKCCKILTTHVYVDSIALLQTDATEAEFSRPLREYMLYAEAVKVRKLRCNVLNIAVLKKKHSQVGCTCEAYECQLQLNQLKSFTE